VRVRTDLEFGGGHSVVKELIPEVEHEPDRGGYTTDSNSSFGGRVDGKNDVRSKTKHGRVQPVR